MTVGTKQEELRTVFEATQEGKGKGQNRNSAEEVNSTLPYSMMLKN